MKRKRLYQEEPPTNGRKGCHGNLKIYYIDKGDGGEDESNPLGAKVIGENLGAVDHHCGLNSRSEKDLEDVAEYMEFGS